MLAFYWVDQDNVCLPLTRLNHLTVTAEQLFLTPLICLLPTIQAVKNSTCPASHIHPQYRSTSSCEAAMDPVTAVGLVASVLQLIDTATKVLVYLNDVKEASSEQKDLSQYVLGLMSTLNMLRSRVEESMSSSDVNLPAIKNLGVENGPLDQIKMLMERLAKKLKPSTGRMDKAGKLLKWPFDKKEVKDVIEQIDRVNTLVALAIQSDNMYVLLFWPRL